MPYVQSDFMCIPGPMNLNISNISISYFGKRLQRVSYLPIKIRQTIGLSRFSITWVQCVLYTYIELGINRNKLPCTIVMYD